MQTIKKLNWHTPSARPWNNRAPFKANSRFSHIFTNISILRALQGHEASRAQYLETIREQFLNRHGEPFKRFALFFIKTMEGKNPGEADNCELIELCEQAEKLGLIGISTHPMDEGTVQSKL